jgi:AraC family transcriptional regulator
MTYEAELAEVPVPFRVEHRQELDAALIEVRRYFWSKPIEQTIHAMSDALVINMALTSRPSRTRVDRISPEENSTGGDAGRLLIMIPGVPYYLVAPGGSFRSLHCAIGCTRFEAVTGEAIDWQALGPFSGEARPGLGIETHLTRIHDELVHNGLGRQTVIEACVNLICVELSRQFRRGRPARPDVHTGGLAAWRMRLIIERIHADRPAPRLAELASLCGLTERQLSRAFKAETGSTLGRVVDEVTTERAHRLLTGTSLPIAGIARELGFASADSFAQSFRRHTGTAPSRIRHR